MGKNKAEKKMRAGEKMKCADGMISSFTQQAALIRLVPCCLRWRANRDHQYVTHAYSCDVIYT